MSSEPPESVDLATYVSMIGRDPTPSDWVAIDQTRINGFAANTGDDAFIHVDPGRAARTRFAGTIAHGLLTLSLLPLMKRSAIPRLIGARMRVNYGFDRVRFLTPVKVDSRVRGWFSVIEVTETRPGFVKVGYDVGVEIEGLTRQALIARWCIGHGLDGVAPPS